ncbi:MAG: cold shock domain-containing protein, partial [Janthinobacterium lividum]
HIGTGKRFNTAKRYGFVGNEGGAGMVAYYSAIPLDGYKSLKERNPVLFDIIRGKRGRRLTK